MASWTSGSRDPALLLQAGPRPDARTRGALYGANRLTVTRQLPYEGSAGTNRTLDLALFVNGVPVATAELKNALTGQGVEDAKEQYRGDRDPRNVTLRRAVVHFAVDTEQVAMTTRLDGASTRFLPFNRGHARGKGNPPNPNGHRTAYLWERVWEKDAWIDLLGRFVHAERSARGTKTAGNVIFPRHHQWDAVLSLSSDARERGAGNSYLVQHSAGSGKSNTIAWLAHRLSNLHDTADEKVFDKVVVITDRVVLDRQLQELNSSYGGTLLIGVADDGSVFGLEGDYATLRKEGKDDRDVFGLHLNQTLINSVGMAAAANVGHEFLEVGGRDLCRVHVRPSGFPVEVDKKGRHAKKKAFYGRFGNGTRAISDPEEREKCQVQVWGT